MKRLFAGAALAALAACSGTGAGSGSVAPGGPITSRGANATLTLRIRVPRQRAAAGNHRRPAYVSPATKGAKISISGPGVSTTVTAGLTPASSGCTGNVCEIRIPGLRPCASAAPCYTATVATYDAVSCATTCTIPGNANELSSAQNVAFTVTAAAANVLTVTLGGLPARVSVSPLMPGLLQGDARMLRLWGPSFQTLVITALDADGDPIVGPGAPQIAVTSGSSNLTVTGPTTALPNRVSLQATTSGAIPVVTPGLVNLALTITPTSQSGGTVLKATVPVTVAHSEVLAGEAAAIAIYYDGNTVNPSVTISGSNTDLGAGGVPGLAVDANGTIFEANGVGGGTVAGFRAGSNHNATPAIKINGASANIDGPMGIAVDAAGTQFVVNNTGEQVVEFASGTTGNTAPSPVFTGPMTQLSGPVGIALDATGAAYVANSITSVVTIYPAGSVNGIPEASISGADTNLHSIGYPAILPDGSICVHSVIASLDAIVVYPAGSSGDVAPVRTITGTATTMNAVAGLTADAAGTIYVANGTTITEYAASQDGNAAPIATVSPGTALYSVAVVPAAVTL